MANVVALKNRNPFSSNDFPFRGFDRLFDDFFMGMGRPTSPRSSHEFQPRIEVREEDKAVVLSAELPGVDQDQIELTVDDDVLTIKGEKTKTVEKEDNGYYSERFYGSFERRISLDDRFDSDRIKADFKNGVLTLTLPKKEPQEPTKKSIPISR